MEKATNSKMEFLKGLETENANISVTKEVINAVGPKTLTIEQKMQERYSKYIKEFNKHVANNDKEFDIHVFLDWATLAPSVLGLPEGTGIAEIDKARDSFGNNELLSITDAMGKKVREAMEKVFDKSDYDWKKISANNYWFSSRNRPNIDESLNLIKNWEPK